MSVRYQRRVGQENDTKEEEEDLYAPSRSFQTRLLGEAKRVLCTICLESMVEQPKDHTKTSESSHDDDPTPPPATNQHTTTTSSTTTPVHLECEHRFHYFCIKEWVKTQHLQAQSPHCPTCRKPITIPDELLTQFQHNLEAQTLQEVLHALESSAEQDDDEEDDARGDDNVTTTTVTIFPFQSARDLGTDARRILQGILGQSPSGSPAAPQPQQPHFLSSLLPLLWPATTTAAVMSPHHDPLWDTALHLMEGFSLDLTDHSLAVCKILVWIMNKFIPFIFLSLFAVCLLSGSLFYFFRHYYSLQ